MLDLRKQPVWAVTFLPGGTGLGQSQHSPFPSPAFFKYVQVMGGVAQEGGVTGIFKAVSQQKPTQLCKAIILQLKKDSLSKKYQQVHMPPEAGRGERQWGDGRGVVQGG